LLEELYFQEPKLLEPHKREIISLCHESSLTHTKWYLARMLGRIELTENEIGEAWEILYLWASNRSASRILRVNSVQSLTFIVQTIPELKQELIWLMEDIYRENIPSLNARIRILKKKFKL
jgi:hypothetical protein